MHLAVDAASATENRLRTTAKLASYLYSRRFWGPCETELRLHIPVISDLLKCMFPIDYQADIYGDVHRLDQIDVLTRVLCVYSERQDDASLVLRVCNAALQYGARNATASLWQIFITRTLAICRQYTVDQRELGNAIDTLSDFNGAGIGSRQLPRTHYGIAYALAIARSHSENWQYNQDAVIRNHARNAIATTPRGDWVTLAKAVWVWVQIQYTLRAHPVTNHLASN
jgi:hypothetical protein